MISANIVVQTDADDVTPEVELLPDGYAWLRFTTSGDTAVCFHGTVESLLLFHNGASDLLVAAQARMDAERIEAQKSMLFDEAGDLQCREEDCQHPIVGRDYRCAACGLEVPF